MDDHKITNDKSLAAFPYILYVPMRSSTNNTERQTLAPLQFACWSWLKIGPYNPVNVSSDVFLHSMFVVQGVR